MSDDPKSAEVLQWDESDWGDGVWAETLDEKGED